MTAMAMTSENIELRTSENHKLFIFIGAISGFSTGVFLMLTGLILSLIKHFDKINFHSWEVVMIVVSFPLLAIGAHCLDLIEKRKKSKETHL